MNVIDTSKLNTILKEKNVQELKQFMDEHNLVIVDGKLTCCDEEWINNQIHNNNIQLNILDYQTNIVSQIEYEDMMQHIKKIQLNSTYGCLLNKHSKFFEFNMGQSTTLTGRCITCHMASKVNELLTGTYHYEGGVIVYGDTDSCAYNTNIKSNFGEKTIEDLFNRCNEFWKIEDKEYAYNPDLKVMSYNFELNKANLMPINYIYRHKVKKQKWRITDTNGNYVDITNDHSVMVERDNKLIEVKPADMKKDDILISITDMKKCNISKNKVHSVEQIDEFKDEYVYDIGIKGDTPYFFANDILIHNSVYFSAYDYFKKNNIDFDFTPENVIDLYDKVAKLVNDSFKEYMLKAFNVSEKNAEIMRCEREVVAIRGLFKTQKRYGLLVIDKEGVRKDKNGSSGELKAMGLEIKRSDSPKFVQDFLKKLLIRVLENCTQEEFNEMIDEFNKEHFSKLPAWKKGSPMSVNNLSKYEYMLEGNADIFNSKRINIPGNSRASINWNTMCSIHNDTTSNRIIDGTRIIVCKLMPNPYNMKSIAYPIDQKIIPDWFKELPFDPEAMENTILEKKIQSIFECTGFDIQLNRNGLQDSINYFFK